MRRKIYVQNVDRLANRLSLRPEQIRRTRADSLLAPKALRTLVKEIPQAFHGMTPQDVAALNKKLRLRVTVRVWTDKYSCYDICADGYNPDNGDFQRVRVGKLSAEAFAERQQWLEARCEDADLLVEYRSY